MENTKIGNKEAIALLTTISFNQIIIFGVKSIINNISQPARMAAHEFHVLEVIARLPPLRATVFSRSSCGWAGVSLNVTEILIFGF